MTPSVWCIEHTQGWCAAKSKKKPADDAGNVPTKCGCFVILPIAIELRMPTCKECRKRLQETTS